MHVFPWKSSTSARFKRAQASTYGRGRGERKREKDGVTRKLDDPRLSSKLFALSSSRVSSPFVYSPPVRQLVSSHVSLSFPSSLNPRAATDGIKPNPSQVRCPGSLCPRASNFPHTHTHTHTHSRE